MPTFRETCLDMLHRIGDSIRRRNAEELKRREEKERKKERQRQYQNEYRKRKKAKEPVEDKKKKTKSEMSFSERMAVAAQNFDVPAHLRPAERTPEQIAAELEDLMQRQTEIYERQAKAKTTIADITPKLSVKIPTNKKEPVEETSKPFRVAIRPTRERTVFDEPTPEPEPILINPPQKWLDRIPLDQRATCHKPWCMHNVGGHCIHRTCITDIDRQALRQRDMEARAKKKGNYIMHKTYQTF